MFLNHIKSINNSIDFSLPSKQKVRFREVEYVSWRHTVSKSNPGLKAHPHCSVIPFYTSPTPYSPKMLTDI